MASESVLQVRVTPDQKKAMEAAARQAGLSLSAWVRSRLLSEPKPRPEPEPKPKPKAAKSQTEGYIEAIKGQRPMPPSGLSRSELSRWWRENR